jgi:hypothetical protein
MSQLAVQLSARADALIAQRQKELFNRRRKKVSAAGVVESLMESAARSPSDKRFATAWKNLVADIDKAAKVAAEHGLKPANLSDEEWAIVLRHRSRPAAPAKPAAKAKAAPKAKAARKPTAPKSAPRKKAATPAASVTTRMAAATRKAAPRRRPKAKTEAPLPVLSSNGLALASPL